MSSPSTRTLKSDGDHGPVQNPSSLKWRLAIGLALALAVCLPSAAIALEPRSYSPSGWFSSLYPSSRAPGFADSSGRFVHDFSYAGYKKGEVSIPETQAGPVVDATSEPYGADPTGQTDSTDAIQRALDDVGRSGGGVVLLPAGTYSVAPQEGWSSALWIRYDRTVLKGAGRGATRLQNTSTYMRSKSVLYVSPDGPFSWNSMPYGANLKASSPNRSDRVVVTDPQNFSAGDLIIARTEATEAWLLSRDWPRGWNSSNMDAALFLRRVVAVDGDALLLDIPVRQPLNFADRGRYRNVFKARAHLTDVGIEDLSIGMVQHASSTGWGGEDYDDAGTAAYDVHDSRLITVRGVIDGWVRRVDTFAPLENRPNVHMLSNGIRVFLSRGVTVSEVVLRYPQYRGAGGNGYLFDIKGSDCLFDRCVAIEARHSFSFANWWTTGNVVRDCASVDPSFATDFHAWHSAANLVENTRLRGDMIDASYRLSGSTAEHGATTSQSTIWNTRGLPYGRIPQSVLVRSIQQGWGAVIGTSGSPTRIVTDHRTDAGYPDQQFDFAQGAGTGALLLPRSVSKDQLGVRRASTASRYVVGDTLPTVEDATVESGTRAWVNDGYAKQVYAVHRTTRAKQAYLKFDVRDQHRISRARLVFYASSLDSKRRWTKVDIYRTTDGWAESKLTWRNKPWKGSWIGSTYVWAGKPRKFTFDVTEYVRGQQADGAVSFVVIGSPSYSGRIAQVMSRESSSAPRLEIEVAPQGALSYTVMSAPQAIEGTATESFSDGSLATGYAHGEHGGIVQLDLGLARDLSGIGIAQELGNRISGLGEVRVSVDGAEYTCVRGFDTAGDSTYIEPILFDAPVRARFVQIVGLGNSGSASPFRSAYKEIELYGE